MVCVLPVFLWALFVVVLKRLSPIKVSFCFRRFGLGTYFCRSRCLKWSSKNGPQKDLSGIKCVAVMNVLGIFTKHGVDHSCYASTLGLIFLPRCFCLFVHLSYFYGQNDYSDGILSYFLGDHFSFPNVASANEFVTWAHLGPLFADTGSRPKRFFLNKVSLAFCAKLLHSYRLSRRLCGYAGVRVGEADNPGPNTCKVRFAITNPTSVVSKIDHYSLLHSRELVNVSFMSETAATKLSQKVFNAKLRSNTLKAVWSQPVPDQFQKLDGSDSLRGRASGVGFVSNLPIRTAVGTLADEMLATSRIQHAIISVGVMQLQLVVIYGLPGTHSNSQDFNNRLLEQAIEATQALKLPVIIGGDFNTDPMQLPVADNLKNQGFRDLLQISREKLGLVMPPTCKDVTNPDNAVCCPKVQQWISDITVLQDQIFDAHKVVIFELTIPESSNYRTHMPLPKSWLSLPIDEDSLPSNYDSAVHRLGTPQTFEEWGECVEYAVDLSYRCSQVKHQPDQSGAKPLPASFRGRCKPRKIVRTLIRVLTPTSRPGDFQPEHEITKFATLKQIVQLRRITSLLRRVKKYEDEPSLLEKYKHQLEQEWQVICSCRAFSHSFVAWAQDIPELGPLPRHCPNFIYLHHLEQIVRFYVQAKVADNAQLATAKRQYVKQLDSNHNGLAQAFASIKETPMPLVETLHTKVLDEGIVASHVGETPLEVFVNDPNQFSYADKLLVNQIPCKLIYKTSDSLHLEPLQELELQDTNVRLEQTQLIHDRPAIFEALTQYWLPFWHTGDQITANQLHQFVSFLENIPDSFPNLVVDVDSPQIWTKALSGMKSKTARGVDGFAVDELKMLSTHAHDDLRRLCNEVYAKGFPPWFMVARTIALSKVHDVPFPHQVRPISILSVIYRLWGKVVTTQIISQLSCSLPPQLTGFLRGRGPMQAAYQQQFDIELANWMGTQLSGISIDLLKCFNTIAREAGFQALRRIKLPHAILEQYAQSISTLSRVWLVEDECSHFVPSTKGFPEGDSFSVVVILALSFGWIKFVQAQLARANLTAYADNWGWSLQNSRQHGELLRLTVTYTECALMKIDWHKTWAWSTCSQHVAALKQALKTYLDTDAFQLVMNHSDLGCQMTYRGPPKLGSQRTRFANAKTRLKKLSSLKAPLSDKVRLVNGGAYSVALYGIEMLPIGESHFNTLRSQTAEGLYGTSVSRNSAIALLCTPGLLDPHLQAILNTIKTARYFLLKGTQEQATMFLQMASRHSGLSYQCRGPAACLKYYLLKLGWTLAATGDVHVAAFRTLNLFRHSYQTIQRYAIQAWQEHLLLFRTDRVGLQNLPAISRVDTVQILRKFTPAEQVVLIREIAATFQTRQQQAVWDPTTSPLCEHCGQIDTRFHRVHTCSLFADIRPTFEATLTYFGTGDSSVHELPVVHTLRDCEFNQHLQDQHPEAVISEHILEKLSVLTQDLHMHGSALHMYTDGSCMYQESPMTRYAAYSIVLDCCVTNADREAQVHAYKHNMIIPASFQRVAAARVTGEQGIHRAELYALVIIAENLDHVVVHVDSTVALHTAGIAQQARQISDFVGLDDFDLAIRIHNALQTKQISFVKIKAHANPMDAPDPIQCYHQLGNSVANDFAIEVCKHHLPHLTKQYEATHATLTLEKTHVFGLYQYLLRCHQHRLEFLRISRRENQQTHSVQQAERVDHCKLFQEWLVEDAWVLVPFQANKWGDSTWGRSIMNLLWQWLQQCKWPKVQSPEDTFGVTWVELATSFFLYSGMFLPVKRDVTKDTTCLVPLFTLTDLTTYSVKYSELVRTFVTVFQQLADLTDVQTWPKHVRGLVRSTYVLGGRTQPSGIKVRPSFFRQADVVTLLQQYLLKTKSQSFDECPPIQLGPPMVDPQQLKMEISGSWNARTLQFRRGAAYIRKWRENPHQGLRW